jgi:rare lipoprotein A
MLKVFSFVVLLFLLQGCSEHRTRVLDTPQTRELKGWQKPYEVDGQRYDPLRDHAGFSERGIASWYGRKFHGRKTSNGEVYNMYALTAAHKTLPLGVYVKVRRLDNGREVIVRVNDRGPFVSGRVIDLSYAAAQKIGMVDSGTTKVEIEALGYLKKEAGQATYLAPSSYDAGTFAVQVGAFLSEDNASSLAQRMRVKYGKASVVSASVEGRTLFRVRAGVFTSLEAAEAETTKLRASGFSGSFVVAFD